MRTCFLPIALATTVVLFTTAAWAAVTPIAVSGYNHDIVVEKGAPANATGVTDVSMDAGTGNTGGTWYEQGYNTSAPTTGLPTKGSTIASASDSSRTYTFPSSYGPGNGAAGTTNDAFVVGQGSGAATISLTTPGRYSLLSLAGSAGNGPNTVSYVISFADLSTQTGTLSVSDWFNASPVVYNANGRLTVGTGAFDNVNAGNPRLYSYDIVVSDTTSPVLSIALSSTSTTSTAAFFALSGTAAVPEPSAWTLLGVGGLGVLGVALRRRGMRPV